MQIETTSGARLIYRVIARDAEHALATYLLDLSMADRLLLKICMPFYAIDSVRPWRCAQEARPESR